MKKVEIVEYEDRYHEDWKRLSLEWLTKYDLLEPVDMHILNNPKDYVLHKGGSIFLARRGEEIVGTASLFKVDGDTMELAKLAVTEKYQGLRIGKRLMERCIEAAKTSGVRKVILYTHHELTAAVRLYKKFHFHEVEHPVSGKYDKSDVKMELLL